MKPNEPEKDVRKMKDQKNHSKARLVAMISRNEMDFIDKIGKDALFSTGRKLSRTDVISAIIDVMHEFPMTGKGIHTKDELHARIIKAIIRNNDANKGRTL